MSLRTKILESNIDFSKKTTKEVSKILFGEIKSSYVDQISAIFKKENIKYIKTSDVLKNKRKEIKNFFKNCKNIDSKSAADWAKYFNVGVSLIFNILKELNISKTKTNLGVKKSIPRTKPIEISDKLNQIIIGSLLGDGSMSKHPGNINSCLVISHSIKQQQYIKYKHLLLSKLIKTNNIYKYLRIDNRPNWPIEQLSVGVNTSRNPSLNKYRDEWYPNGIKIIPESVIQIKPLALAIWFMDDGSKSKSSYNLYTNGFSSLDTILLKNILYDKYNIKCNIWKNNVLYIKSESKDIFTKLIKPFIHESMEYKLHKLNK